MKQRMLAWLCAGILGLGCWGLPAAAADDTTEPTTQVTTEAETETESPGLPAWLFPRRPGKK